MLSHSGQFHVNGNDHKRTGGWKVISERGSGSKAGLNGSEGGGKGASDWGIDARCVLTSFIRRACRNLSDSLFSVCLTDAHACQEHITLKQ
jgi:hypothetical protein